MDSADGLLPVELERNIFELAAFLHPECALALMMVAQRAQIWCAVISVCVAFQFLNAFEPRIRELQSKCALLRFFAFFAFSAVS
jgi:hypothetical protein